MAPVRTECAITAGATSNPTRNLKKEERRKPLLFLYVNFTYLPTLPSAVFAGRRDTSMMIVIRIAEVMHQAQVAPMTKGSR